MDHISLSLSSIIPSALLVKDSQKMQFMLHMTACLLRLATGITVCEYCVLYWFPIFFLLHFKVLSDQVFCNSTFSRQLHSETLKLKLVGTKHSQAEAKAFLLLDLKLWKWSEWTLCRQPFRDVYPNRMWETKMSKKKTKKETEKELKKSNLK